jgi:hypothetical protein
MLASYKFLLSLQPKKLTFKLIFKVNLFIIK